MTEYVFKAFKIKKNKPKKGMRTVHATVEGTGDLWMSDKEVIAKELLAVLKSFDGRRILVSIRIAVDEPVMVVWEDFLDRKKGKGD